MNRYLQFILVVLFIPLFNTYGQECGRVLEEAGSLYEEGLIEEIPQMLKPCMEDGFSRAQKIEAYKLIILAYLFDDNQFEAERTMDEFLSKYPEYEIMPGDPVEFVYLFESYGISARFSITLAFGPTISSVTTIENYSMLDARNLDTKNFIQLGFQAGIGASYELSDEFKINLEAFYSTCNYEFEEISENGIQVNLKESLRRYEFPLTVTYQFGSGDVSYYVRGGFATGVLSKATGEISRQDISTTDYELDEIRNTLTFSGIVGGGARLKVPRGFLFLDARLSLGINQINNSDNRWSDELLQSRYFYVDDDFLLNSLSINIGYSYSFYRSKKN